MASGVVAVNGDEYDSANSSGIAKLFADAFAAVFSDFKPGAVDGAGKKSIEAMASAVYQAIATEGAPPVGSILGLRTDKVDLPTNGVWVPMDGRFIDDPDSPFNGQTIEDWNGDGRFLRGGSVAGVEQAQDTLVPAHAHSLNAHTHGVGSYQMPAHAHDMDYSVEAAGSFTRFLRKTSQVASGTAVNATELEGPTAITGTSGTSSGNTATDGGSGSETRPINGSVTWIIRIK